jgi:hypothetical protein
LGDLGGYTLPPEDPSIRSILIRAERTHAGPLRIEVIQQRDATKPQYQLLVPDLKNADFRADGFLPYLSELLNL